MSRHLLLIACALGAIGCLAAVLLGAHPTAWGLVGAVLAALAAVGVRDMLQTRHSVLRNYPIAGHMRWLIERIRPEIRQYLMESDQDGTPFTRSQRSLVYASS